MSHCAGCHHKAHLDAVNAESLLLRFGVQASGEGDAR